jgi:hypothetical protein
MVEAVPAHYALVVDSEEEDGYRIEPSMSVAELLALRIGRVKSTAFSLARPTDWLVIRSLDPGDGTPVPTDVQIARAAIREASDAHETALAALAAADDYAGLAAYDLSAGWPS